MALDLGRAGTMCCGQLVKLVRMAWSRARPASGAALQATWVVLERNNVREAMAVR